MIEFKTFFFWTIPPLKSASPGSISITSADEMSIHAVSPVFREGASAASAADANNITGHMTNPNKRPLDARRKMTAPARLRTVEKTMANPP